MLGDGEVFWKTRSSGKPGDTSKQTMTIEPVADGIKLTTVIDFGSGAGMTTTYVTKLDGAEVPVYSAGKVVMTLRGKKTGPNTYEGSVAGPGGTSTSKTTLTHASSPWPSKAWLLEEAAHAFEADSSTCRRAVNSF